MKRVIIDVDVGTDDAVALLLFLHADAKKLIKIEAITCVNGNTLVENVVRNVVRLVEAANRTDIPVYKGACEPLILPEKQPGHFHGKDGFGDLGLPSPDLSITQKEVASIAMGKIVTDNPGEIHLVALGPLTNIALSLKLYPQFRKDLKELHLMGGNYKAVGNVTKCAEFNFFVDPEAAHMVLECCKCPIFIVTWETTLEPNLSMDWRYNVLGKIPNPVLDLITRAEKSVYPRNQVEWLPCDAFLAATFLYPDRMIKKKTSYHATLELHGSKTRGQVVLDHLKNEDNNVVIIEDVDEDVFKELLLEAANMQNYH